MDSSESAGRSCTLPILGRRGDVPYLSEDDDLDEWDEDEEEYDDMDWSTDELGIDPEELYDDATDDF
jgi:hypothetical protein